MVHGWRFHLNAQREWRWQQLSHGGDILRGSTRGFCSLEACVSDAQTAGYVFRPAVPGAGYHHQSRTLPKEIPARR